MCSSVSNSAAEFSDQEVTLVSDVSLDSESACFVSVF